MTYARIFVMLLVTMISLSTVGGAVTVIPAGTVSSYNLNTAGELYKLGGNVTATGAAFVVGANNVVLDCMGYRITFATSSGATGFYSNGYSATIKNGSIVCGNDGVSSAYPIYFYNAPSGFVDDMYAYSYKSYGAYIRSSHDVDITNSNVKSYTATTVYKQASYGNSILNSEIGSYSGYALYEDASYSNTIDDSYIYSNTSSAVYLPSTSYSNVFTDNRLWAAGSGKPTVWMIDSTGNDFINNSIISTTNIGLYMGQTSTGNINCLIESNDITVSSASQALYVYNGHGNEIYNNTCTAVSNNGVYFRNTKNNTVIGNTFTAASNDGWFVGYGSNNNVFISNTGVSSTRMGVFLYNVTGNSFSDSTIIGPYCSAPHAQKHIMMIGDSITEGGQGGTVYGGYGLNVANALNAISPTWYVSNQGFSGERTWFGRERYTQELDIFEPTHATIMYGTNDLLDARPQQDIIDDILWMANESTGRGLGTYILLTPCINTNNELRIHLNQNLSSQAIAAGFNVVNTYDATDLVPWNGAYDGYNATNFADGIHPNNAGNAMISRAFMDAFAITPVFSEYSPLSAGYIPQNSSVSFNVVTDGDMDSIVWRDNGAVLSSVYGTNNSSLYHVFQSTGTHTITATATFNGLTSVATWVFNVGTGSEDANAIVKNIWGGLTLVKIIPMIVAGVVIIAFLVGKGSGEMGAEFIGVLVFLLLGILLVAKLTAMI